MHASVVQTQSTRTILGNSCKYYGKTFARSFLYCLLAAIITIIPTLYWPDLLANHVKQLGDGLNGFFPFLPLYFLFLIPLHTAILKIAYNVQQKQREHALSIIKLSLVKILYVYFATIVFCLSIILGYIALIIPGIIVMVLGSLFMPLIVIEHYNPWKAFQYSYLIVRHHWWQTFIALLVPLVFYFLATLIFDLLARDALLIAAQASPGDIFLGYNIVEVIVTTLFLPWFYNILAGLFTELRLRAMVDGLM